MKLKFLLLVVGITCMSMSFIQAQKTTSLTGSYKTTEAKPIDVLLLLALPASGKSEARRYLANLSPKDCESQFGIKDTVQFDDFPYVHMMRRISEELMAREHEGMFFSSPVMSFREPKDWGTLIQLVNEDYSDLIAGNKPSPVSAAEWLFDRLDAARTKVGAIPALGNLPKSLRNDLAASLEKEATDLLNNKIATIDMGATNKTVVIEFARGGAADSPMPLPEPYGYKYSLAQLSPEILDKASILYIWVSPEEARRKNEARTDPNDPGSILNHGVPLAVMYNDYGCDDISWMLENSNKANTAHVESHGNVYNLPVGRFDNRTDKTSFLRNPPEQWSKGNIASLQDAMKTAFNELSQGSIG